MTSRIDRYGLHVDAALDRFVMEQALPGTGLVAEDFWKGFSALVHELAPVNKALLAKRDALQMQIDAWCKSHLGQTTPAAQETFLREIGYLVPEGPDFQIDTANVDDEIARVAGPQLVVPVTNARYAINAANARWAASMIASMAQMPWAVLHRWAAMTAGAAPAWLHGCACFSTRPFLWWAPVMPMRGAMW